MKIEVTARDIYQGTRHACNFCPVALAVARALGLALREVSVTNFACRYSGGEKFVLPEFVMDFIVAFDRGDPVAPFSFELAQIAKVR